MPPVIDSTDAILELTRRLLAERFVALDTESDSLYHYREKVCLIQLSSPGTGTVVVDPLGPGAPDSLGQVMENPAVTKILHGSDFDITSLKRDFGWTFAGMFDTAIAARFLGWTSFGLAAVAKRLLDIDMQKGEQTSDWSIRPLPERMLAYAGEDVEHLVEIYAALTTLLIEKDRLAWVVEESAAVAEIQAASPLPAPADFMKAAASRDLSGQAMAVLRELFAVREAVCLDLDRPRFKLVSDDALASLTLAAPRTVDDFVAIRWLPPNIRRSPERWVRAIRAGLESPPVEVSRPRRNWKYDPLVGEAIERLRSWRAVASADQDLDPGVLLPNRLVTAIAMARPRTIDELRHVDAIRNWRCDAFGTELLAAVAGK